MELKKTSLYEEHVRSGATMVEFAGFLMPIHYTSLSEEHHAVRQRVGMFDVSHMGEIFIEGRDATAFLAYLFTNDVREAQPGSCTYGFLCYPSGGVVDDLIVYKYSNTKYLLVVNASNTDKDYAWLLQNKTGFVCAVTNVSDSYSQIALQGPRAREVLARLWNQPITLGFYQFEEKNINQETILVSATGYTGEDGVEIYGSHAFIVDLWQKLVAENVTRCGLGCRDTLRFEANMPLYGHELDQDITPLEAGLGFALDWTKHFIGIEALLQQKETGLKRKIVGLELLDKGVIRHPYKVYYQEKEVGYVTTGYVSPTLQKALAFALLSKEASSLGTVVEVEMRNKRLKAVVRNKKFYEKKNKQ